ncbi:cyanamide hydratase [Fusarium flagelliforme]|uniref:Cyanamide hydratase n=1 Tax=Fusarium flagelliforme TaxID=2675880 RepID=A0A395MT84_9HYPO|nr:cyanamide hydratase [Fusarium flagelliforme]
MSSTEVQANGWTAVPVSAKKIIDSVVKLQEIPPYKTQDIPFPSEDKLVAEAQAFAKARLSPEAYNHSMRVFYWGTIIAKRLLPEHAQSLSPATWALTCLLHDIGTAEAYFTSTRMSFDIYGGIKAMEVLKVLGGSTDQAEAVAEAIIRHQDMGVDGTITFLGQLIQLATLYDNVGAYEGIEDFGSWIDETTRDSINNLFPRHGWCSWFACTVRKEVSNKPWCHTTHIPQFDQQMEANTLMKPWE